MLYVNSKLANVPKDLWLVHPKTWKVTINFNVTRVGLTVGEKNKYIKR